MKVGIMTVEDHHDQLDSYAKKIQTEFQLNEINAEIYKKDQKLSQRLHEKIDKDAEIIVGNAKPTGYKETSFFAVRRKK